MMLGDDAHVTNLLVAPDMRRRGFARRILIGLIDSSLESGAKNLTLEVRSKNMPAISLYRRFGLSPIGSRPGYYGDDDALIMWVYDIDQEPYSNRLDGLR